MSSSYYYYLSSLLVLSFTTTDITTYPHSYYLLSVGYLYVSTVGVDIGEAAVCKGERHQVFQVSQYIHTYPHLYRHIHTHVSTHTHHIPSLSLSPQADQSDRVQLQRVIAAMDKPVFAIIDDGSHIPQHQVWAN